MTHQQAASKYPLRTRVIAWLVLAAIFGGAVFFFWSDFTDGKLLKLAIGAAIFAWAVWRYRPGARDRNR